MYGCTFYLGTSKPNHHRDWGWRLQWQETRSWCEWWSRLWDRTGNVLIVITIIECKHVFNHRHQGTLLLPNWERNGFHSYQNWPSLPIKKRNCMYKIIVKIIILCFYSGKGQNLSSDATQEFCIDEDTSGQPYSPPSRVEAFELFKKGRGKEINRIFLQNKGKSKEKTINIHVWITIRLVAKKKKGCLWCQL